jgi:Carboxymuconolactone decarboxylase family
MTGDTMSRRSSVEHPHQIPARAPQPQPRHDHRPRRRLEHPAAALHLDLGRRNGLTRPEISEAITHLAFYTSWLQAMSAMMAAKQKFAA